MLWSWISFAIIRILEIDSVRQDLCTATLALGTRLAAASTSNAGGGSSKPAVTFREYAVFEVVGPPGRGIEHSGLQVCVERRTPEGTRTQIRFFDDNVVSRSESLRVTRRETDIATSGSKTVYEARYGTERTVRIEIDGRTVRNRSHDPFRPNYESRAIPREMDDPIVIEEDLIPTYEAAFRRFLAGAPASRPKGSAHPLEGVTFDAIVPHFVALMRMSIAVRGPETLELGGGPVETTRLEVSSIRFSFFKGVK